MPSSQRFVERLPSSESKAIEYLNVLRAAARRQDHFAHLPLYRHAFVTRILQLRRARRQGLYKQGQLVERIRVCLANTEAHPLTLERIRAFRSAFEPLLAELGSKIFECHTDPDLKYVAFTILSTEDIKRSLTEHGIHYEVVE